MQNPPSISQVSPGRIVWSPAAFTLVEVMIGAAILTIMSAIVLESFGQIYRRSVDNRTISNAYVILQNQIQAALNTPCADTTVATSAMPPSLVSSVSTVQIFPNPTTLENAYYQPVIPSASGTLSNNYSIVSGLFANTNSIVVGTLTTSVAPITSGSNANLGLLQIKASLSYYVKGNSGEMRTLEMRTVRSPDL